MLGPYRTKDRTNKQKTKEGHSLGLTILPLYDAYIAIYYTIVS